MRSSEVIERDDGLITASSGMALYFSSFDSWPSTEQQAMRFVRGRVLDTGCGAGRAALYLQELGHDVAAIDVSPLAIEVCRRRGVRDAQVMPVTRVSRRLGTFDTVLLLGNNFGLLGNPRRARWILQRFHACTSAAGRIIAGSRDPGRGQEPEHRLYHRHNKERGLLPGQLRVRIRYNLAKTPWIDLLMVSPAQMRSILRGTGWHVGELLTDESPNFVAVIEKD